MGEIIKKSIFKQKVKRKMYEYTVSFFQPKNDYKDYFINCFRKWKINEYVLDETIKEENIYVLNLEMPLLEINEKFYIEELDLFVVIKERIRTSKENICYYIEDKLIEDEISLKSKKEVERKHAEFEIIKNDLKGLENDLKKLENGLKEYAKFKQKVQNNFWYSFMKKSVTDT